MAKATTMVTSATAAVAAGGQKKRRLSQSPKAPVVVPSTTSAGSVMSSTKRQRLEEVSAIAKDVMIRLLTDSLSFEVTGDEWERLVELTQRHPNYTKHFAFPSATEPGWVTPKRKSKPTHLKVVALDCEMCVTAPVGEPGVRKGNALCRVSAVDGEDMIRSILSDLIVHQPEDGYVMVDPKTDIHGITLDMINQSRISVAKAQRHLLKYINADTIVVGHSVHGDLASLRIDHRRVIDTALIFQRRDGDPARATPGLKCLTKHLLGFEMPDGHDSAIDAQASMLAAKYAARNACGRIIPSATELHGPRSAGPATVVPTAYPLPVAIPTPTTTSEAPDAKTGGITATARVPMRHTPSEEVMTARSCRLRVHRLSKGLKAGDIEQFFIQSTKIVPSAVENIVWQTKGTQTIGTCHVTFSTMMHANLAFVSIVAKKEELDSIGRPQKTVAITNAKGKAIKGVKVGVM